MRLPAVTIAAAAAGAAQAAAAASGARLSLARAAGLSSDSEALFLLRIRVGVRAPPAGPDSGHPVHAGSLKLESGPVSTRFTRVGPARTGMRAHMDDSAVGWLTLPVTLAAGIRGTAAVGALPSQSRARRLGR